MGEHETRRDEQRSGARDLHRPSRTLLDLNLDEDPLRPRERRTLDAARYESLDRDDATRYDRWRGPTEARNANGQDHQAVRKPEAVRRRGERVRVAGRHRPPDPR